MTTSSELRDIFGQFATGVTVVTTGGEEKHGMTVNSFTSVSLEPPLVLFNADKGTNTHDKVPKVGHYAVNILTLDQQWISDRFAGKHHEMNDPFEDISTMTKATGAPIIRDTLAYIDCSLQESFQGGDHTIYLGHIEEADQLNRDSDPLTFYQGGYGTIE